METAPNKPTSAIGNLVENQMAEINSRAQRRKPVTRMDHFAQTIIKTGDWMIYEQQPQTLPRNIAEFLTVKLRDECNALIEETRLFNNRHAGRRFHSIYALSQFDCEILDLKERILKWAEAAAHQVLHSFRHQIKANPVGSCAMAYKTFVSYIDTNIAYGSTKLNSLVWSSAMDLIPYILVDKLFFQTKFFALEHSAAENHPVELVINRRFHPDEMGFLSSLIEMYGFEITAYAESVILQPLLAKLLASQSLPDAEQMDRDIQQFMSDISEAYPYLLSSSRVNRYTFDLPETKCAGAFSFLGQNGIANFTFGDNRDSLERGLQTSYVRAYLDVRLDGQISFMMHPWKTLERTFGGPSARILTYWLLKQIHHLIVADYLKINHYYLDLSTNAPIESDSESVNRETEIYSSWVKHAQIELSSTAPESIDDVANGAEYLRSPIPQIRRSQFFKLLAQCGVRVEQGKGSELKLLRGAAHPFRLGNHYGPNPTIPSFLAGNILKRLEITRAEWDSALCSVKLRYTT